MAQINQSLSGKGWMTRRSKCGEERKAHGGKLIAWRESNCTERLRRIARREASESHRDWSESHGEKLQHITRGHSSESLTQKARESPRERITRIESSPQRRKSETEIESHGETQSFHTRRASRTETQANHTERRKRITRKEGSESHERKGANHMKGRKRITRKEARASRERSAHHAENSASRGKKRITRRKAHHAEKSASRGGTPTHETQCT